MLNFVQNVVSAFPIGPDNVQVALAVYTQKLTDLWQLNRYEKKKPLMSAIGSVDYVGGYAMTGNALFQASRRMLGAKVGRRRGVRAITVVMTDGKSSDDVITPASLLRNQSVVLTVGIRDADRSQLEAIASEPPELNILEVTSFAKLLDASDLLFSVIYRAQGESYFLVQETHRSRF